MRKADIVKMANKDIQAAKARGEHPTSLQNRDPYPQAPQSGAPKSKKKPQKKK